MDIANQTIMNSAKPTAADKWVLDAFKLQLEKTRRDMQSFPQTLFPCDIWVMISRYATEDPLIIDAIEYSSCIQAGEYIDLVRECFEVDGFKLPDDDSSDDENEYTNCECLSHFRLYFKNPEAKEQYNTIWGVEALSYLLEMHDFTHDHLNRYDDIDRIALVRSKLYSIIEHHIKPSRVT